MMIQREERGVHVRTLTDSEWTLYQDGKLLVGDLEKEHVHHHNADIRVVVNRPDGSELLQLEPIGGIRAPVEVAPDDVVSGIGRRPYEAPRVVSDEPIAKGRRNK